MRYTKSILLKDTAEKIRNSSHYQWGHMGSCNCGHLFQVATGLAKADIHKLAMEKAGDWRDKIDNHCDTSGYRVDRLITEMIALGFTLTELEELERLENKKVLGFLGRPAMKHNDPNDVALYLEAWAELEAKNETEQALEPALVLEMLTDRRLQES